MAKRGDPIQCRARVADDCYQDKPEFEVYDPEGPGQSEDGTYDLRTHTVVCDACYFILGAPSNEDLPARIAHFRGRVAAARQGNGDQ